MKTRKEMKKYLAKNIYVHVVARGLLNIYRSIENVMLLGVKTDSRPVYRNLYVLSPYENVAYLNIAKTGCSSIRSALLSGLHESREYSDDDQSIHILTASYETKWILQEEQKPYVFTFVRNPFERLVSLYLNKFRSLKNLDIEGFLYKGYLNGIFDIQMEFGEFVETVSSIPDCLADRHFKSQYSIIYPKDKSCVDFIGKFESFEKDFDAIRQKFESIGRLPHLNKSVNVNYMDFYDERLVDVVERRYLKDIEEFGYQQDMACLKSYVSKKTKLHATRRNNHD